MHKVSTWVYICKIMQALQIIINGKVYKTGFRYFLMQQARKNNLTGFVKYTEDLSVLCEVEGNPKNLDQFVLICRNGFYGSSVSGIQLKELYEQNFSTFEIQNWILRNSPRGFLTGQKATGWIQKTKLTRYITVQKAIGWRNRK